jgi:hypothetical protein
VPLTGAQSDLAESELRRQLATLALSHVQPSGGMEAIAAASWWNMLARLGLRVPLVVVHDLGLLLSRRREGSRREVTRAIGGVQVLARYQALLAAVATSEIIDDLASAPLRDDTVAVILARLIGDVYLRWPGRPRPAGGRSTAFGGADGGADELPVSSPSYERDRAALAREMDPGWALAFLHRLVEHDKAVLARLDQIDPGALRLLGLFSVESGVSDLADMYQMISTPGTADIVDFSLQLLPSLLETKRRPAAQRFSIDGYASVERRGNLDNLLPGELAHDNEIFTLKALSDDLLFYGHERQPDTGRKLHYVLISRLHDRLDVGGAARRELPRLLGFRSERGRNYARVFGDLATEIARLRREQGREVALTIITHAECHIPTATVEALARDAYVYAIFVLPSKPIDLDYLSRLHRYQVVTADSLSRAAEKRRRALEIVEDVANS